ncbi:MAG: DNA polymerase III subunit delta' C-terminal domain-containing protein [Patescibacteria group bacterium]
MSKNTVVSKWPIVGNRPIVDYLQKVVADDNPSHAYLFVGPKHIGKMTTARYFISSLLCHGFHQRTKRNPSQIPCQQCNDCTRFQNNSHPDIYYVNKEEGKKDIVIEQIQQLRYNLKMTSFYNSYKAGVINKVELLNQSSVSALLKTLEEPTKNTIIILIANNITKVPQTVISRCQVFNFQIVSTKEIESSLIDKGVSRETAHEMMHLSRGKPGLALRLYQDPAELQNYRSNIEEFFELRQQSLSEKIRFYHKFIGPKADFQTTVDKSIQFCQAWQLILRDLILAKLNHSSIVTNYFIFQKIESISKNLPLQRLYRENQQLLLTQKRLKQNVNPKLLIENFLINLP